MKLNVINRNLTLQKFTRPTEMIYIIAEDGHYRIYELYKLFSETNFLASKEIFQRICEKQYIIIILKCDKCFYYNKDVSETEVIAEDKINTDNYIKVRGKTLLQLRFNDEEYIDTVSEAEVEDIIHSTFVYVRYVLVGENILEETKYTDQIRNLVMDYLKNYDVEVVTLDYNYSLVRFESDFGAMHFVRVLQQEFNEWYNENFRVSFSAGIEFGKYDKYYDENSNYFASYNGIALNKAARMSKLGERIVLGSTFYKRINDYRDLYKIKNIMVENQEMKGFEKQDVYICNFK